jgi:hypothetical protein
MKSEARKEYEKKYRELNKEKLKAYRDNWYETNKEHKLLKSKQNYQSNKVKRKKQTAQWLRNNPAVVNFQCAKRRAKKLQATPSWLSEFDLNYIKCLYAQAAFLSKIEGISYHIDHIYPLQGQNVSGLHVPSNLQILKASENIAKSNKSPDIV